MKRLTYYYTRIRCLPAGVVWDKARRKASTRLRRAARMNRDLLRGSHLPIDMFEAASSHPLIDAPPPTADCPWPRPGSPIDDCLEHRFDLLGSGPVLSAAPSGPPAVNRSNRGESQRLRDLIREPYQPIDWHIDPKSGHRWAGDVHTYRLPLHPGRGADIRLPWELGRLQHLPQMALAYADGLAQDAPTAQTDRYLNEYRNQVLDFLASNPPRFGVQWACTMDVAIRAVNLIVAHDLFAAAGAPLDAAFRQALKRAVQEHALFIATHLEWFEEMRNNHYLADLVGLLVASAWLPRSPQTDVWLALAVQELVATAQEQFHPDGSNFEASTSYHCLSAEMVAIATAAVLGLNERKRQALREYDHRRWSGPPILRPAPVAHYPSGPDGRDVPFPPGYLRRLDGMARFIEQIRRPDGQTPQFGDNDSGRLLKLRGLVPSAERTGPVTDPRKQAARNKPGEISDVAPEESNRHDQLPPTIRALLAEKAEGDDESEPAERWLVRHLSRGNRLEPVAPDNRPAVPAAYPGLGLYVWQTEHVYLAVRCGPVGQHGCGGHAHNDQLSFELSLGGRPVVVDPGTYVYASNLAERNRFRSTAMHNVLQHDGVEQNPWADGLFGAFRMRDRTRAEALEVTATTFRGVHHGLARPTERRIEIHSDRLVGVDRLDLPGPKRVRFHLDPSIGQQPTVEPDGAVVRAGHLQVRFTGAGQWSVDRSDHSPAYGVLQPAGVLCLESEEPEIPWRITWTDGC